MRDLLELVIGRIDRAQGNADDARQQRTGEESDATCERAASWSDGAIRANGLSGQAGPGGYLEPRPEEHCVKGTGLALDRSVPGALASKKNLEASARHQGKRS